MQTLLYFLILPHVYDVRQHEERVYSFFVLLGDMHNQSLHKRVIFDMDLCADDF